MELEDAVRRRRMVRSYDPGQPVPRETVDGLLALAVRAPSAGNTQGWHFLVLDDPDSRSAFWSACADGTPDRWRGRMQQAPVLIAAFSDKKEYLDRYAEPDKSWTDRDEARWPIPYWHTDTAMAVLLVLLGATEAGLGACWFGVPGPRWPAMRATFGVPDRLCPVGVISLGYPAASPDPKSPSLRRGRRGMAEVVSYGRFGAQSA